MSEDQSAEVSMSLETLANMSKQVNDMKQERDDALKEVRNLKIAHQTALEQRNRHGLNAKKALAEVERLKEELNKSGRCIYALRNDRNRR